MQFEIYRAPDCYGFCNYKEDWGWESLPYKARRIDR